MGVASGCGEQEVGVASGSGWNLWVWLLGVVVRRYIDFLILLIPTPLVSVLFCSSILFVHFLKCFIHFLILLIPIYSSCICSFLQQHPYFLFIKKCFSFLSKSIQDVMSTCIIIELSIYRHLRVNTYWLQRY